MYPLRLSQRFLQFAPDRGEIGLQCSYLCIQSLFPFLDLLGLAPGFLQIGSQGFLVGPQLIEARCSLGLLFLCLALRFLQLMPGRGKLGFQRSHRIARGISSSPRPVSLTPRLLQIGTKGLLLGLQVLELRGKSRLCLLRLTPRFLQFLLGSGDIGFQGGHAGPHHAFPSLRLAGLLLCLLEIRNQGLLLCPQVREL